MKSESGAILILGSFIVIAALGLAALLIDVVRAERALREIQSAVDQAALAGSQQFRLDQITPDLLLPPNDPSDVVNDGVDDWRSAKVVAYETLVRSKALGVGGIEYLPLTDDPNGDPSVVNNNPFDDPATSWNFTTYSYPPGAGTYDFSIVIERGFSYIDDAGEFDFISLEALEISDRFPGCDDNDGIGNDIHDFFDRAGSNICDPPLAPTTEVAIFYANAVRVRIENLTIPTLLGRLPFVGTSQFTGLSKEATASQKVPSGPGEGW